MSYNNPKYKKCKKDGLKAEDDFQRFAQEKGFVFVRLATTIEQKGEKFDSVYEICGRPYKIEVKSSKKNRRSESDASKTRTVVELCGIYNSVGWLYGSADIIAFQMGDYFILVDKLKLQQLVSSKISKDLVIKNPRDIIPDWQAYRRKSQPTELCVYVPYEELMKCQIEQ